METHVKAVAYCFIWFGVLSFIGSLTIIFYFGNLQALYAKSNAIMFGIAIFWSILYHLALSIPTFVLGIGLLRFHDWARFGSIVIGALNILNLPVGTILGPYSIGVLMSPETELLFSDRFRASREFWRLHDNDDPQNNIK